MKPAAVKIYGACLCGQFRYEAEINPDNIAVCHCTDCQVHSATAFRVGVMVPADKFKVVDERLAGRRYMLGDDYTIVDMSLWGWTQLLWFIMGKGTLSRFPNVKRHHDEIAARPAAKLALGLRGRHNFKMEVDDEMCGHMFRHLAS